MQDGIGELVGCAVAAHIPSPYSSVEIVSNGSFLNCLDRNRCSYPSETTSYTAWEILVAWLSSPRCLNSMVADNINAVGFA